MSGVGLCKRNQGARLAENTLPTVEALEAWFDAMAERTAVEVRFPPRINCCEPGRHRRLVTGRGGSGTAVRRGGRDKKRNPLFSQRVFERGGRDLNPQKSPHEDHSGDQQMAADRQQVAATCPPRVPPAAPACPSGEPPRVRLMIALADAIRDGAITGDLALVRCATRTLSDLARPSDTAGTEVIDILEAREQRLGEAKEKR